MKKTLLLLLLIPAFSFSQAPRGFSVVAGVNSTSLNSSDIQTEQGIGLRGGLTFNLGYHETYNYQAELIINQSYLNFKGTNTSTGSTNNSTYAFQTFEFGWYFNYYILKPDEDKFFVGVQVGPSASFGASLTPKGGADVTNEVYAPHALNENELNSVPSFLLNGGVGLTGGYNDFRFDLRYTHGFSNVMKSMQVPGMYDEFNRYTGPELSGKTRMISFAVSYRIAKFFGAE